MQSDRRKCRKFRFVNSAPAEQGTRTALAGSPLTGGEFFAEDAAGSCALRSAGECGTRRGGKKEGTPAVSLPL